MQTKKTASVPSPAPKSDSPRPLASIEDTAAHLRAAPLLTSSMLVTLPPSLPEKARTFAQLDLRKLDATLTSETDLALQQLVTVGSDQVEHDLGPAAARVEGVDGLLRRRKDNAAIVTRLRVLLDFAETQQRVFDHDAVLMMEAVGEAVTFHSQYDAALRERYSATLSVLAAKVAKIVEGRARNKPAPTT